MICELIDGVYLGGIGAGNGGRVFHPSTEAVLVGAGRYCWCGMLTGNRERFRWSGTRYERYGLNGMEMLVDNCRLKMAHVSYINGRYFR